MTNFIKPGMIAKCFPGGDPAFIENLDANLGTKLEEAGCPSAINAAWYLANVAEESAGLTRFVEGLSYSAHRLMAVWPKRFPNLAYAARYSHSPEKLANKVYAGRMGNGDEASGDGFRYRGRGPIQITGKEMYAATGFLEDPDAAASPEHAADLLAQLYKIKKLDKVKTFVGMVKLINGGTTNLDSREHYRKSFEAILKS